MQSLIACGGCGRHVRPHEVSCPFCSATTAGAPRPIMQRRFSRFAMATGLALAACSSPSGEDAGMRDAGRLAIDAGNTEEDAGKDGGRDEDAGRAAGMAAPAGGRDAGGDAGYDAGMFFPPYGAPAFADVV
jgi:hypothetical protein